MFFLALRPDNAVRNILTKLLYVVDLTGDEEMCIRLATDRGGCGITAASQKLVFANLAAACQYMPAVTHTLRALGWSVDQIDNAIDFLVPNGV